MKEKIKKITNKKNLSKAIVIGTTLIILIVVFYIFWFSVAIPQRKKATAVDCFQEVLAGLKQECQEACHLEGKEIEEDGLCPLSAERANSLHQKYENKKKECVEKYPIAQGE